jgi:hypothetical protein
MRDITVFESFFVGGGFANVIYDDPDFPPDEEPGQRFPHITRRTDLGRVIIKDPTDATYVVADVNTSGLFKKPGRLL